MNKLELQTDNWPSGKTGNRTADLCKLSSFVYHDQDDQDDYDADGFKLLFWPCFG